DVLYAYNNFSKMRGLFHHAVGVLCRIEIHRRIDHRTDGMMLKRRIHGAEHIARSDIDALQRDRFAHEYRRIHQAAAQDTNQRYPPANTDRGGRLLQGSPAADRAYEINAAAIREAAHLRLPVRMAAVIDEFIGAERLRPRQLLVAA